MSYKFSLGERTFDDITAEVDAQANTKIDFEEDYIGLVTSGSSTLVISGSMVGIGTSTPSSLLTIDGVEPKINFREGGSNRADIFINDSDNLKIVNRSSNKHIVFEVNDGGTLREGLRLRATSNIQGSTAPEVVINDGSESLMDFRVESDDDTHMIYVDGANNKVGIGTKDPAYRLHVDGNVSVNQYIYHNDDADTYINFTDDRIRFNAGGINLFGMHKKDSAPHQVTVNNGGNNVDFVANDNSSNTILRTDASTSRVGINTDSPAQILDINGDTIRLRSQRTIPNSNTFGEAGEICYDANYIYICIATDTWKRIALSSW